MSKSTADALNKISVWFLNQNNYFSGWMSGTITWTSSNYWGEHTSRVGIQVNTGGETEYLRIYYTQTNTDTNEKRDFDYKIPLTSTSCGYGGERYWFICPWYRNGIYCGRRVGVLYKGGDYFACRHCYNLTYETRNQSGRYKGFVSVPDLDKAEEGIKRYFYQGKPTKKYRRLLDLNDKFERGFMRAMLRLGVNADTLDDSKK
jgi:hypothetical protein